MGSPSAKTRTRRRGPAARDGAARWKLIALLALLALALTFWALSRQHRPSLAAAERSELLLAELGTRLQKALAEDVLDLRVPGSHSRELFADSVTVNRLEGRQKRPRTAAEERLDLVTWSYERAAAAELPIEALRLWEPFFAETSYVKHAKVLSGVPAGEAGGDAEVGFVEGGRYRMRAGLGGLALMSSGRLAQIDARMTVDWAPAAGEGQWRIVAIATEHFELTESNGLLFTEVLEAALPDAGALGRARDSLEYDLIRQYIQSGGKLDPRPGFDLKDPAEHHPGVAIVDIDRDGWDDVYVAARLGPDMLLRNLGDGTFEEVAADLGLRIDDHVSSAIFADFDNDGDDDAFLGRTRGPATYLVNEDGRFVDRSSELLTEPLPEMVTSVSAADFDGDGLLDLYLARHAAGPVRRQMRNLARLRIEALLGRGRLLAGRLPDDEARRLAELALAEEADINLRRPGPPNLLFRNRGGGRFERFEPGGPHEVWLQTYQATPADYDGDGDVDLYLANDFAPNNLLRNRGDGTFEDVTAETATADVGFGMGASWADYDGDGLQDLYITNMYSKAGLRITGEVDGVSEALTKAARGNSLLRNAGGGFEHVSGRREPAMLVEKAGWGWGGQFVDADNDGFPDIHALSGLYTAPPEVAIPEDT